MSARRTRTVQEEIGHEPDDRPRPRITPALRHRLVRVGIAAVAVIALVIVPGYIALRPGFTERYPDMRAEYDAWTESVHAKVSCQECHIPPSVGPRAAFAGRMLAEFYISSVFRDREVELFDPPKSQACSDCHVDLRSVSPSGDLLIPHQAHIEVLGLECIRCHEYLVHSVNPEGTHTPRMEACMECHDGEQAKNGCAVCHTQKAVPVSHESADWDFVHAEKTSGEDCESCHAWTPDWCVECHSRRPVSHGDDWRSTHRERVEQHRNCEACHVADFCIKCHGERPSLNFDPTVTLVD